MSILGVKESDSDPDLSKTPETAFYLNNKTGYLFIEKNGVYSKIAPFLSRDVHITSTQILALKDSPAVIVPAPGVGSWINCIKVFGNYNYLTTGYDLSAGPAYFYLGSVADGIVLSDNLLGDMLTIGSSQAFDVPLSTDKNFGHAITHTLSENKPVLFSTPTANPLNGDGDIFLTIWYTIEKFRL